MKKKTLVIGGIVTAIVLAGGWALAQSRFHGPGAMMGMGPGMHGQMGPGMRGGMGLGMMGMGRGMMGGSATMGERSDIHDLFFNHDRITRTVTNLPNGIRTVTESDDPQVAEVIKRRRRDGKAGRGRTRSRPADRDPGAARDLPLQGYD